MIELKQISYNQLKIIRYKQWQKQNEICPILKQKISYEEAVADHKHKTQMEVLGEDGKGLLRGVIHNQANVMEGKIARLYKRCGLHKFNISLPELLRSIADYLEQCPMQFDDIRYVHPNERPKAKKIGKRDFNRIVKLYFKMFPKRRKLPVYPKRGKMSKELKELLKKANNFKN